VIDWRCVAAAVDVPTNGRHLPGGVIDWRCVAAVVDVPTNGRHLPGAWSTGDAWLRRWMCRPTVGTYRGPDRLAARGRGGGCADQRSAP